MCDSVNNSSIETIYFVREKRLADTKEDKMKKNGHVNSEESKEYQVTLEKLWGTVGLQLEVRISQRSVRLYFIMGAKTRISEVVKMSDNIFKKKLNLFVL